METYLGKIISISETFPFLCYGIWNEGVAIGLMYHIASSVEACFLSFSKILFVFIIEYL